MDHAAIDLHKKESEIRIVTTAGELLETRIPTTAPALAAVFGGRPPLRVLLEASTESEWVAQTLERLGHTVVVADPNYLPMYGTRQRRVKTDRRDVQALCEANRLGIYRPVHRRSAAHRALQAELTVRQVLVGTRTRTIAVVRALTRGAGLRIPSGATRTFRARLGTVAVPAPLAATLAPLLTLLQTVDAEVAAIDARLARHAATTPVLARLQTMPGVGPLTAAAVVAALDTPARFPSAAHVASYLGVAPREYSSAERRRRGSIGPSAHPLARGYLVQAAWRVWRSTTPACAALRAWATTLAARRGRAIAAVALARRLARVLFAMWRTERPFDLTRWLVPGPVSA